MKIVWVSVFISPGPTYLNRESSDISSVASRPAGKICSAKTSPHRVNTVTLRSNGSTID